MESLNGRLGTTRVWEKAEKTDLGERQFTTEVTFDGSGGRSFQQTHTFCGNLEKGLGRYWFKLVRIKCRQTSYGCDELVSIILSKEPSIKRSNIPTTRIW